MLPLSDSSEAQPKGLETIIGRIESTGPVLADDGTMNYASTPPEYYVMLTLPDNTQFIARHLSQEDYHEFLRGYNLELVQQGVRQEIAAGEKLKGRYAIVLLDRLTGLSRLMAGPELDAINNSFLGAAFRNTHYS